MEVAIGATVEYVIVCPFCASAHYEEALEDRRAQDAEFDEMVEEHGTPDEVREWFEQQDDEAAMAGWPR